MHEKILCNKNEDKPGFMGRLMTVTFLKLKMAHLARIYLSYF